MNHVVQSEGLSAIFACHKRRTKPHMSSFRILKAPFNALVIAFSTSSRFKLRAETKDAFRLFAENECKLVIQA